MHRNKSENGMFDVDLTVLCVVQHLCYLIGLLKTNIVKSKCFCLLRVEI